MLSQHSQMYESQPIPKRHTAHPRFARIGELGMKALHGSERLRLGAGLICLLVYVSTQVARGVALSAPQPPAPSISKRSQERYGL